MRWQLAAWVICALTMCAGCVEDAEPTLDRDTRRLDGGPTADAGWADQGPIDVDPDVEVAGDATPPDAATPGPDAGCAEDARAERDCPEGGTQSRICGRAGWSPCSACPATCPVADPTPIEAEAVHGDVVELSGLVFAPFAPRPSGPYDWVVLEAPGRDPPQPVDHFFDPMRPANGGPPDDRETAEALLYVGRPGRYALALYAGGAGPANCLVPYALVYFNVVPRPTPGLSVTLTWWTDDDGVPVADAADLDLHLLHPAGQSFGSVPYDCFWGNTEPDWGPEGPTGNPRLDADPNDGEAGERITLDLPEETDLLGAPYCVGVEIASLGLPGSGLGATHATVRVFQSGAGIFEAEQILAGDDSFWLPACVFVSAEGLVVQARGQVDGRDPGG